MPLVKLIPEYKDRANSVILVGPYVSLPCFAQQK